MTLHMCNEYKSYLYHIIFTKSWGERHWRWILTYDFISYRIQLKSIRQFWCNFDPRIPSLLLQNINCIGWTCHVHCSLSISSCVNIYIYMYVHSLYEFCYRTYIYIYNGSVIQYWRSCTPSRSKGLYFWGVRCSWAKCHFFVFCGLSIVSCSLIKV